MQTIGYHFNDRKIAFDIFRIVKKRKLLIYSVLFKKESI